MTEADELNPTTDKPATFLLPRAILEQDAVVIDEQENHLVMTLRVSLDLIRDNHTTLACLSEIATGRRMVPASREMVPANLEGNKRAETYLGDGLFASFDGWQVKLRAPRENGDDEVFLEDGLTMREFLKFLDALKAKGDIDA